LASFYPESSNRRLRMESSTTTTTTETTTDSGKPVEEKHVVKTTIMKNPKTTSSIQKKVATMSTSTKSKVAKELAPKCAGMTKTKKCGKGHGFCTKGWCHKKYLECGTTSAYKKNSLEAYINRPACVQLNTIKTKLKEVSVKKAKKVANDNQWAQWNNWDTEGSDWGEWTTEPESTEESPAVEEPTTAKVVKQVVVKKQKAKPAVKPPAPAPVAEETPAQRHKVDVSDAPSATDIIIQKEKADSGKWQCWCYSDYKEHRTCPDLREDID